ncbi:hypothetical protein PI124_g21441 [Phytophthora idaei]|nr:hypothetical protein PI124_g21441 [Phytophthora idaei]
MVDTHPGRPVEEPVDELPGPALAIGIPGLGPARTPSGLSGEYRLDDGVVNYPLENTAWYKLHMALTRGAGAETATFWVASPWTNRNTAAKSNGYHSATAS